MKITIVAGARPNFMKIAPIIKAITALQNKEESIDYRLVHTGQHFDKKMSGDFFEQLRIPEPHANLNAGGGSQAEQTAAIMVSFEKELIDSHPDVVLVVGDVTSTMACAITAKKLCIDVVHVEAGIRSGDMGMPEEINRIVTDSICDHFFTTTELANSNLIACGVKETKIHFVGNTMIDTLYQNIDKLRKPDFWDDKNLEKGEYFVLTLHRPSNVDNIQKLNHLLDLILEKSHLSKIVFPVHPRTKRNLDQKYFYHPKLILSEPLGYHEFIYLVKNSKAVITDSGGITEETTVLNIPCLTLRNSTERPETVNLGSNILVGTDPRNLIPYLENLRQGVWKKSTIPPLWDGRTAERIVERLLKIYVTERKRSLTS
ncbi:MAG: UDP-N-acetylglucosamine 2-epimerase (non-hydrolyzing) [Flavobacterium sp.]|nr:MAG: UDP-N-acetylglucosamine 2-epimerase (non-hydrolyzing) [Flavobacterium sp.]